MALRRTCARVQRQRSTALALSTLDRLLQHSGQHAERFELGELYKVGILLKDPNDVLELRTRTDFLASMTSRYALLRQSATPFQTSLLDVVLPQLGASPPTGAGAAEVTNAEGAEVAGGTAPVTARDYYKAIVELAREVEAEHYRSVARAARASSQSANVNSTAGTRGGGGLEGESASKEEEAGTSGLGEALGSSRASALDAHLTALEPNLRQLSGAETCILIKTLAKFNHTNYQHSVLLTRRGCEVAGELKRHELCQLFFNLHKLHTRDSLVSIVNGLLEHVSELTAQEVLLLTQSLERQESTSSASQRLVAPLVAQGVKKLPDATSGAYHGSLLVSMARYNHTNSGSVHAILRDWLSRWKATSSDRDVVKLLEAAAVLVPPAKLQGLPELVSRLTELAPTMSIRNVDRVMDILSMVPLDVSAPCMEQLMGRIEREAGQLSTGQLVFILHLLSSYPPAQGHPAMVSLAYTAAFRAASLDAESLESVLLSLAMVHLFTDDFFVVAHVLQAQKGGVRTFAVLRDLMEHCTPEMAATKRGLGMLANMIHILAPSLDDEQLASCRRALMGLGVRDPATLQGIFSTAKRLHRTQSGNQFNRKRRGGNYDPMEGLL